MNIVIHHNPDCGTSRNVLAIIEAADYKPTIIEYLPTTGAVYRWEFVRSGRTFSTDVPGSITVTEGPVTYAFARQGLGLTYAPDLAIADDLAAGRLQRVLEPFSLRTAGLYLYFPTRAQSQPKLRAFIDIATSTARTLGRSHRFPS